MSASLHRKSIIKEIRDRGLNMINVQSHFEAAKALWVHRIFNTTNDEKMRIYIKILTRKYNFKMTFQADKMISYCKPLPTFYQEVVCAFNK